MSRRVLLCVSGLSPQVVTETLYALAHQPEPWIPDEVWLVTTAKGAEHARLTLFVEEGGWFNRLVNDYSLPQIVFTPEHILTVKDTRGRPLEDIRTEADNLRLADMVTEQVRRFCADPEVELHVSLAGGRKTMSFFAGYILSLFGRAQDRLSHVLVEPQAFESHPQFFYPTPESSPIRDRNGEIMDRAQARVSLSEVPFLRLSGVLDAEVLQGRHGYEALIRRLQSNMEPEPVVIDLAERSVRVGGTKVDLKGINFVFYAWMVARLLSGDGPIDMPLQGDVNGDAELAQAFLRWTQKHGLDMLPHVGRSLEPLEEGGMSHNFVRDRKYDIKKALREALGLAGEQYAIVPLGRGRQGLRLPAELFTLR